MHCSPRSLGKSGAMGICAASGLRGAVDQLNFSDTPKKAISMHKLSSKFILIAVGAILLGCATPREETQLQPDDSKVLILSGQGVDPSKDTAGFNKLAANVTQAFAEVLSSEMKASGKTPINVLDQSPKYKPTDKLAIHAVRNATRKAILLELSNEDKGNDQRLNITMQYLDLELATQGGGVRVKGATKKEYLLRSSLTGDSKSTVTELAKDFMQTLRKEGKL